MKRGELRIGDTVRFAAKVYRKPYVPYYDAYKGHKFTVKKFHYDNSHVEVVCADDTSVKLLGYVHPDELAKVRGK